MELNENNTKQVGFYVSDNQGLPISYQKGGKLITALFMVTDIMDKDENIRIKLRNLGIEILSDMHLFSSRTTSSINVLLNKTNLLINLLDISLELGIISQMNFQILKKEFTLFKKSIQEYLDNRAYNEEETLQKFFQDEEEKPKSKLFEITKPFYPNGQVSDDNLNKKPNGQESLKIGLQTPSTLMDTLRNLNKHTNFNKNNNQALTKNTIIQKNKSQKLYDKNKDNFAKEERRLDIIKTLKANPKGLTISDIKSLSKGQLENLGEKTLQRELVAMVKDNILYKTGEKRWSKYFLNK
jgi:hypothetical protein